MHIGAADIARDMLSRRGTNGAEILFVCGQIANRSLNCNYTTRIRENLSPERHTGTNAE